VWNGRRVVSKAWVERSTAPHVRVSEESADGYDWHLYRLRAGSRTYREYEANGNGGRLVIVLPELDLAIAFTAGNYNSYGLWRRFRDELVPQCVIPAALDR
jgi:CubicO group peptidase (beta-lactamase class C family)